MSVIDDVLHERALSHGDYVLTARLAQALKDVLRHRLADAPADIRESVDMICTKLARVASGNPGEADHWKDIAGYARLIERRLIK